MPLVPSPPTRGPNVRTQCAGTPGAGGQGHWVHLPQRHHCFRGLSLLLLVLYSQSLPQRVRPSCCFSPEKRGRGGGQNLSPRLPDAGLKQFPFLAACLWTFASQAPAEAPAPP